MGIVHHHRIFKPLFLFLFFLAISLQTSIAQPQAQSPSADVCNGIYISYAYTTGSMIAPYLAAGSPLQPYKFESQLTVLNNGLQDLKSWEVFVGFQHDEYLVSASNAVLVDGTSLPAAVGNGTGFAGYPNTDLKTAVETAGDVTQMQAMVNLVGTQFGVDVANSNNVPMPSNISLLNGGYICPVPTMQGTTQMSVCCTVDPNVKTNTTTIGQQFSPRQTGDLVITYDVIQTYASNYMAQVTIANTNPLGRLDYWMLSWDWMRGEFIGTMRGAYPTVVDPTTCLAAPQGTYYQGLDFANDVLNCDRRPTIVDLPLSYTNDSTLGKIPYCCRNGTLLSAAIDPTKSTSVFQMQVYKMPPDLNRTQVYPPANFQINGTFNPNYQCGPPVRVSPSAFPASSGVPSINAVAFATWEVVCNMSQPSTPKCCVSFSSYLNDSIIPCNTCACGCQSSTNMNCSTTASALLLPTGSNAALVPFDNRTKTTLAWAQIKHYPVPNPMPCGDNCGVSLNWNLYTSYTNGWSARVTLFNWGGNNFADWSAAIQLDKATPGFQQMYSFNASVLPGTNGVNNTIIMYGVPGLNYLIAEDLTVDPPNPGKQQSVISFTTKSTPGIQVPGPDAFPSKVFFNGLECSIPTTIPSKGDRMVAVSGFSSFLLAIVVLIFVQR